MKPFKHLFAILPALFLSLSVYADDLVDVKGKVYDDMSQELIGATVKVLQASDSTVVASGEARTEGWLGINNVYTKIESPEFKVSLPNRDRKYIVAVDFQGFETDYIDVDPAKLPKNEYEIDLGKIYLHPVMKKLSEVSVVATKIKFYNKGDTIVYNADAFNLPEGSMLDALVRQLPNVRLTQDGEIFVNEKKVESLLLNGKDLFGKDHNSIMLNNLGSYMVKNLKVYEKQSFESEIAGRDLSLEKPLVMDVLLKKEFMYGMFGNMEAGYGTHDRFMGRLFLGGFTQQHQLVVYGNANNVNNSTTPQKDDQWRPESQPTGTHDFYNIGLKHVWNSQDQKWTVSNHDYFRHVRETDGTEVTRANFLSGGDTYEKSYSRSKNRTNKVQLEHNMMYRNLGKFGNSIGIIGSYENWNRPSEDIAATLSKEPQTVSSEMIRNVYSGELDSLRKTIINRSIQLNRINGHFMYGKADFTQTINLPSGIGTITTYLQYQYRNRKEDRFQRFDINYGYDANPAQTADRYYKMRPQIFNFAEARVNFNHSIGKNSSVQIQYWYKHSYNRTSSELYRLELLDEADRLPFGELPSVREYQSTLDMHDSYLNRSSLDQHIIAPTINKDFGKVSMYCTANIAFSHQGIDYLRGSIHEKFTRNSVGSLSSNFGLNYKLDDKTRFNVHAYLDSQLPDLVNMVNMTDSLDPLNVKIGNRNLKNSNYFTTTLEFNRSFGVNRSLSLYVHYGETFNALAMGYTYDSSTGVRTTSMYNVSGNRTFGFSAHYNTPLASWLSLRNYISGGKNISVDLIGENSPILRRNKVRDWSLRENLNLNASFSGQTVYLRFDGDFRRYSANLANFNAQNTWTMMTGAGGIFRLPFGLEVSTDFSVYNRRGYTDPNLNTDTFVWNARLAYSIMKGNMTFMVDGYDMLRNIDNVSYAVNAQGRTETIRTVLPSYFMAHVQWKFNKSPRK